MLKIKNLSVKADKKKIITDLSLDVAPGEIHVLMGRNGSGKSTLGLTLLGSPNYKVTSGKIIVDDRDVTNFSSDERALSGLFLSFQHPLAITGLSFRHFLRMSVNNVRRAQGLNTYSVLEFERIMKKKADKLGIKPEIVGRSLNEDCSGGEKKKNELLQLVLTQPKYAVIDECDSGLDIDAIKVMAKALKSLSEKGMGILLITHYERLLAELRVDKTSILDNGRIVKSAKSGALVGQTISSGYGIQIN